MVPEWPLFSRGLVIEDFLDLNPLPCESLWHEDLAIELGKHREEPTEILDTFGYLIQSKFQTQS